MNERLRPGRGLTIYAILAYVYLYLPIFFLILFSFNTSKFSVRMEGLTLKWYGDLFKDQAIGNATRNTLIVASTSTVRFASEGSSSRSVGLMAIPSMTHVTAPGAQSEEM